MKKLLWNLHKKMQINLEIKTLRRRDLGNKNKNTPLLRSKMQRPNNHKKSKKARRSNPQLRVLHKRNKISLIKNLNRFNLRRKWKAKDKIPTILQYWDNQRIQRKRHLTRTFKRNPQAIKWRKILLLTKLKKTLIIEDQVKLLVSLSKLWTRLNQSKSNNKRKSNLSQNKRKKLSIKCLLIRNLMSSSNHKLLIRLAILRDPSLPTLLLMIQQKTLQTKMVHLKR